MKAYSVTEGHHQSARIAAVAGVEGTRRFDPGKHPTVILGGGLDVVAVAAGWNLGFLTTLGLLTMKPFQVEVKAAIEEARGVGM